MTTETDSKAEGPVRMGQGHTTTAHEYGGWATQCHRCGWYMWSNDKLTARAYANSHQCREEATA